jgi:dUTP pyrophosphatase
VEGVKIKVRRNKKLEEYGYPEYKSESAVGMDLRACIDNDIMLKPGAFAVVNTGLYVEIPEGYEIQIRPRSGLARNNGVTVLNTPGTIDPDFRGEIQVVLINLGKEDVVIKAGDRIAQLVLNKVERIKWEVVDELSQTERGEGGFGSTGVR